MPADPSTESRHDPVDRRTAVAVAGHRGEADTARTALDDPDGGVRATALSALARSGAARVADVERGLDDHEAVVRRRATEVACTVSGPGSRSTLLRRLRSALEDPDPLVVEGACWALGERRDRGATTALSQCCEHEDTRCREAAVAALGAVGDPAGVTAVLGRLTDKPTVRRRAVVALAAFEGPEVEAALRRALSDRDWQVRQAASALLGAPEETVDTRPATDDD